MLGKLVRKGRLIVTDYDGKTYDYGDGSDIDGRGPVRVRLTDKGAARHIARYPRVGAGEAPVKPRDFTILGSGFCVR